MGSKEGSRLLDFLKALIRVDIENYENEGNDNIDQVMMYKIVKEKSKFRSPWTGTIEP